MDWKQLTVAGTFAAGVVGLLAYEAYALINKTPGDTISAFVWQASAKYPVIPLVFGLAVGLLCGHFWWQKSVDPR